MGDHPGYGYGIWVLNAVVLAAGAYLAGVLHLRRRGHRWPGLSSTAFVAGLLAVATAAQIPQSTFAQHVSAHLLFAMIGPALLALSAPVTLALRTLPLRYRRAILVVVRSRFVRTVMSPAVVLVLDIGALYGFYLTPMFGAAHERPWLFALIHIHMFLAGCLFSWYLIGRDPLAHRPSLPVALSVLVVAAGSHDILAKLLYSRGLPVGAGNPEQLRQGAQLMYYGGTVVETAIAVAVMTQWYRRTGRALHHERRRKSGSASRRR